MGWRCLSAELHLCCVCVCGGWSGCVSIDVRVQRISHATLLFANERYPEHRWGLRGCAVSRRGLRPLGACAGSNQFTTKQMGVSVPLGSMWRCRLQSSRLFCWQLDSHHSKGLSVSVSLMYLTNNVRDLDTRIAVIR